MGLRLRRENVLRRISQALLAVGTAGLLMVPMTPASASTTDQTCHYEPVSCACRIVVTVLRDLTGDPWTCAN